MWGLHIGFELFKGAVQQGDVRLGRVVFVLHAGAADHCALRQLFEDGLRDLDFLAEGTFQVLQCNVAGAEQGRFSPTTEMTVDSTPTSHSPPSKMRAAGRSYR